MHDKIWRLFFLTVMTFCIGDHPHPRMKSQWGRHQGLHLVTNCPWGPHLQDTVLRRQALLRPQHRMIDTDTFIDIIDTTMDLELRWQWGQQLLQPQPHQHHQPLPSLPHPVVEKTARGQTLRLLRLHWVPQVQSEPQIKKWKERNSLRENLVLNLAPQVFNRQPQQTRV